MPRQLVVAPVLDFDMSTVQVAVDAGVGGILFLGNHTAPSNLADQLRSVEAAAQVTLTPLVMADEEGGGIQRLQGAVPSLPWARDLARTSSPTQVRALAARVGRAMLQSGVDVDLAPVLDLDGRPGPSETNPDGSRSFSAVPSVTTSYGVAFLEGLRSAGVLPVVKHFPGLGGASGNTDYGASTTPALSVLETAGLLPFRAAITAGAPAVMVSNAAIPGLTDNPAAVSSEAIDGLLRHTLGFQGLVLTDSLSAGAIAQDGLGVPSAAAASIAAGADMVLFGSTLTHAQTILLSPPNVAATISHIVNAVIAATASGSLSIDRLNNAVSHILTARNIDLCRK